MYIANAARTITSYNLLQSTFCKPKRTKHTKGVWIHGPPGIGKSHLIRQCFPNIIIKDNTKWFPSNLSSDTILYDDFEPNSLVGRLLAWTDCYPFSVEYKGGQAEYSPKLFIITSNFYIDEVINADNRWV